MILKKKFFSSISNKLFITLVLLIGILLSFQVLIQHFILDDAYEYYKKDEIHAQFSDYIEELAFLDHDLSEANQLSKEYIQMYEHPLAIADLNGYIYNDEFLNQYFNYVTIEDDQGNLFNIIFDDFDSELTFGSTLNISGILISSNWIYPIQLESDEDVEPIEASDFSPFEAAIYTGKIIRFTNAKQDSYKGNELALRGFEYLFKYNPTDKRNTVQVFEYDLPEVNSQVFLLTSKFTLDSKDYYVSSLEYIPSIQEQLGVINKFNIVVFAIGLLLSILISKLYSKSLSKPMIELKDIALGISQLDFSQTAKVHSNDEIGSLAESLNTVSVQLHNNIEELKSMNEELALNYEKKSIEEQRAKNLIMNLSHELNTPLGIVTGFNEILKDGINDKEPEYYNEIIAAELERMGLLINDMLELSKLEASEYKLDLGTIHVSEIIEDILTHYQADVSDRKIKLAVDLPESDIKVIGNEKKIHQVVNNLISNAAKYTIEGGVISITSITEGDCIRFQFENSCDTITEEDIPKLWEKFYRTDKTNTRNKKGSGLGLSIVKEILHLHGSHYGVEKTEDGVCFFFTLERG